MMATWRTPEDLKAEKEKYADKLAGMDDMTLREEANNKIWLSAYANHAPRSDFHWQANLVKDACGLREKPEIYREEWQKLYDEARGK